MLTDGPSDSHALHHLRRERVFLGLAGVFLGTLAMLNLLGISRFIDLSFTLPFVGVEVPMILAVGVLPYPVTFLCTDLICEFYGQRRANDVVAVGFVLNLWVVFILWLGGVLPGTEAAGSEGQGVFFDVRRLAFGAVAASMAACLAAQLVDVQLFHFWKRLTHGRHLWLRNNGSTMVSQLVDTVAVITITHFYAGALPVDASKDLLPQLGVFIASGYAFKVVVAALDTFPFYAAVSYLSAYLDIDPREEH